MGRKKTTASGGNLPQPPLARRLLWVAGAALWLFLAASLISFDTADPPSHVVAVHNAPTANLCGRTGAVLAYWTYYVIGIGAWILMAGVAAYLVITATGRVVSQPVVRGFGLVLAALAVTCFHGMMATTWPRLGIMAGAEAGLVSVFALGELIPRFSYVGTLLILLAAFGIGAVLAVDRLVIALPGLIWRQVVKLRGVRLPRIPLPSRSALQRLAARPEAGTPALVSARKSAGKRNGGGSSDGAIDADAGGIGATDAFDPDDHVLEDDEEDYEYEYVDEDEDAEIEEPEPKRRRLTTAELKQKIAKLPVRMAGQNKSVARDEDIPREPAEARFEGYKFPTLDLLEDPESNFTQKIEKLVREQAEILEEALQTYNIDGEVVGIESGPVVTQYAIQLAPGTKVAKVSAVSSDLARALKAQNIRIVPNMPGRTTIGIEVPNLQKEKVRLKELMSCGASEGMTLPMFLGKDVAGEPLVSDLTRMPHMLIAGTTGSGKSVCMNTIIMSWLYTKRPDELKLVLVDPKMVEMSQFSEIPHLMCPVVTESSKAAAILEWAVNKMEERYELLREARVRDIAGYNALTEEELYELFDPQNDYERAKIPKTLPYMVFVIDELADLMMTHREAEHSIVRIAQKARAVGIHLILATQRPQANVVTGLIKSNMPCRISFKVASGMDSRIVLDHKGAELLLGQGDMLFLTPHTSDLSRAQGTLVTDVETRRVAKFLKDVAEPTFERSLVAIRPGTEDGEGLDAAERDPLFEKAVDVMIETGRGSVSLLQRRLAIGYSRASRLVDQMAMAGILGDHKGSVAREVLITQDEWDEMKRLESEQEASGTLFAEDADEEAAPVVETLIDAQPEDSEARDTADDEPDDQAADDEENDEEEYEYEYVDEDEEATPDDDEEYEYEYEYVDEDDESEEEEDDDGVPARHDDDHKQ